MTAKIRRARITDVRAMHRLLSYYAEKKELLPRAISEIFENLQCFHVAEHGGKIVGTCALYVTWDNLAEIKALAVAPEMHGKGIGMRLLQACLDDARALGITRVFCLTMRTGFFEKAGFDKIHKVNLPHKVWTECVKCPYFPDACIEIGMLHEISASGKKIAPRRVSVVGGGISDRRRDDMLPSGVLVPTEPESPSSGRRKS